MTSEILKDIENLATIINRNTELLTEATATIDRLAGPKMGLTGDTVLDAAASAVARAREALVAATALEEAVAQLAVEDAA